MTKLYSEKCFNEGEGALLGITIDSVIHITFCETYFLGGNHTRVCIHYVIFKVFQNSQIGVFPSKVVFHQVLSSIKGCLPSSIKDRLPSKVVFH